MSFAWEIACDSPIVNIVSQTISNSSALHEYSTKCALVFGGKVYVAWKQLMLHDVIGGHQAHIDRKKDGIMGHPVLQLAKTTLGSRAAYDIINYLYMNI